MEAILSKLDYQNINEIPPFDKLNPSAENIAYWVFQALKADIGSDSVKVKRVEIREMADCGAAYYE